MSELIGYVEKEFRRDIFNVVDEANVEYVSETYIDGIYVDIYIPSCNIAIKLVDTIDMNNIQRDKMQSDFIYFINKGIRLINIFEYEWFTEDSRNKNIRLVRDALNNKNRRKIYARSTKVYPIDNATAKQFIEEYHLQNFASANINLGLFYKNEMIGIMTFGKPRFNYEYEYELIRLTYKNDVNVYGGSEKLFKYFVDNYNPTSILSYCSITKFSGSVYNRIGMKLEEYTAPNYMWVNNELEEALPRYKCMKHKLLKKGMGTPDMTENEIMRSNGYCKVYDAGNSKYGWKQSKKPIKKKAYVEEEYDF